MIVVRVELHSARTGKITEIGRMTITNDGTHETPGKRGNYLVRLMRRGSVDVIQRSGAVKDHARKSASIWTLVRKALASVDV